MKKRFLAKDIGGKTVDLITLHHSMYYCEQEQWMTLLQNIYRHILAPAGSIHCTLMVSDSRNRSTTTWLYNHFAGKYFGHRNDQSLPKLRAMLQRDKLFNGTRILGVCHTVRAWGDDFEKFMFFKRRKSILQYQDHLIFYRGIPFKGLT